MMHQYGGVKEADQILRQLVLILIVCDVFVQAGSDIKLGEDNLRSIHIRLQLHLHVCFHTKVRDFNRSIAKVFIKCY